MQAHLELDYTPAVDGVHLIGGLHLNEETNKGALKAVKRFLSEAGVKP